MLQNGTVLIITVLITTALTIQPDIKDAVLVQFSNTYLGVVTQTVR
jgi:hypothetical protein